MIPDGTYAADSTKNHPFSFREALITEKEELKKIVANEGRVIHSIAEACGGKGSTADVAAAVSSAKSTLVKNDTFSASTKASERTILHLQNSLEQVQEHNKRLKVDLATSKGGGVMGGEVVAWAAAVSAVAVGVRWQGGGAVGGLGVPDRARPFPSLFTLARNAVPPVVRPGFCTVTAGSEGIGVRNCPGRFSSFFCETKCDLFFTNRHCFSCFAKV